MGFYQRAAILFFVTGAGTGYLPWFPGTAGTLPAIPLSLALNRLATTSLPLSLLTLIAFILIATWFCERGEEVFHQKDCRKIVIDEVAGFLLANFLSPPEVEPIVVAFLVFRFLDTIKLFPASKAEQIQGGVGVILDDMVAGLYTFLILRLLYFWRLL